MLLPPCPIVVRTTIDIQLECAACSARQFVTRFHCSCRFRGGVLPASQTSYVPRGYNERVSSERLNSPSSPNSASEPPLPRLEAAQRPQEIHFTELRPERLTEVVLAVRRLPQQEPGQADLAAGADNEIRIGQPGRVQVLADLLCAEAVDDFSE